MVKEMVTAEGNLYARERWQGVYRSEEKTGDDLHLEAVIAALWGPWKTNAGKWR